MKLEHPTQCLGSTFEQSARRTIPVGYVEKPSIELECTIAITIDTNDWRMPVVAYLRDGPLPEEKSEARKIRTKVACFLLVNGILYQ